MAMLKYKTSAGKIFQGDSLQVLKQMPDESVNCCVTSPPYWGLRDYGVEGQMGLEKTPEEYVSKLVSIFREVYRVLRNDGTLFLNLGDSHAGSWGDSGNRPERSGVNQGQRTRKTEYFDRNGHPIKNTPATISALKNSSLGLKPKDLCGIPWMLAFALRNDGWYLRQDIIWHKPNAMPESVKDRCTKAHEYIFLLSKSARYYYDHEAILEPVCDASIAREDRNSYPNHQRAKAFPGQPQSRDRRNGAIRSYKKSGNLKRKQNHNPNSNFGVSIPWEGAKRNKRSVWNISTKPFSGAHFAVFPPDLIEPCILAGCPQGGTVLDPFFGSGTTGVVAYKLDRKFIGIELSQKYLDDIAIPRIKKASEQRKLFAV